MLDLYTQFLLCSPPAQIYSGKEDTLGLCALAFLLKDLFNQFGLMEETRLVAGAVPKCVITNFNKHMVSGQVWPPGSSTGSLKSTHARTTRPHPGEQDHNEYSNIENALLKTYLELHIYGSPCCSSSSAPQCHHPHLLKVCRRPYALRPSPC